MLCDYLIHFIHYFKLILLYDFSSCLYDFKE